MPASMTAVTFCTKSGAALRYNGWPHARGAHSRRNLNLVEVGQGLVYQFAVPPHHLRPALAVRLFDGLLDVRHCLLAGQDARDAEKARLHDSVDAPAHAGLLCERIGVDGEEPDLLLDNLLLHLPWQVIPDLVGGVGRIQQENRSLSGVLKHVDLVEEVELVAGHEAGAVYEIGGADGPRARAQVRDRDRARFLGVVHEVALHIALGFLADDLDRVLVGADGAVGAQAIEQRSGHVVAFAAKRADPRRVTCVSRHR